MSRVALGDVTLNYEQAGEGTDLVLVHGLGGSVHSWDADVPVFARHHRVLRVDMRGCGASDKPPGPYSPALFASDLRGVLDHAQVAAAHLLGISMGGVIAQRFALDYPERVRSVTLVSTSSEVGAKSLAAWQRLADLIEREGFDARSADASRAFSPGFVARHPEVVAEIAALNAANDPRGYAAAARAMSNYNWTAELSRLRSPVLILQGLDDQLTPPGGAVKMSRGLPHARLLFIAEAGHNLPLERPEVFQSSVLAFIAGVDFARSGPPTAGT